MNNKAIIILLAVSLCVSGCSQTIVTGIPDSTDALPEEMTQLRESVHETIETEMTAEETIRQRNVDTGGGVTKEAAKAYLNVIDQLILLHGEGAIDRMPFDNGGIMNGTAIIRLIDFDGDGKQELYCAYAGDSERQVVDQQVIYGYSPEQGLMNIMGPCRISNPGTDVSPETTFLYKEGKVYLMESQEGKFTRYLTVRDNVLVAELEYEDGWNSNGLTVNGKSVTAEELADSISEMESGGEQKTIYYLHSADDSELAETVRTREYIELLADKSEHSALDMVINATGWLEEKTDLTQVKAFLDMEDIRYMGTFNQSRERIDITLEDGSIMLFLSGRDSQCEENYYRLILAGNKFDKAGFCEVLENGFDVSGDMEYGLNTSTQLIDELCLYDYSQTELSIYRNLIYARHGRIFEDPFLNAVFSSNTWYLPRYDAMTFAEKEDQLLSDIEKENIKLIVQNEINRGYRKKPGQEYELPVAIVSGSWHDLDGDGIKEKIQFQSGDTSESTIHYSGYRIQVDSSIVRGEDNVYNWLYIANLDGKQTQLLVGDRVDGDDGWITAYSYVNGKIKQAWGIPGFPGNIQITAKGVYTYEYTIHLQCWMTKRLYQMQGGKMEETEREFYEHGNEVKALIEIPTYDKKEGSLNGLVIQTEDIVVIVGGDNRKWICLKKKVSGEIGWIKVEGSIYIQPDGTEMQNMDVFEGLNIFG